MGPEMLMSEFFFQILEFLPGEPKCQKYERVRKFQKISVLSTYQSLSRNQRVMSNFF